MEKFIFTVDFTVEEIVNLTDRKVDRIKVGEDVIGYVAMNKTGREEIITPFISAGELREAHCAACAAQELFAVWARIPSGLINMAEDASPEPGISIPFLP